MDRVSIKEKAKASLKANYGISVGATLLFMVISGIAGGIPFAMILLGGPMTVGFFALLSSIYHNGTEVSFDEMFTGFKEFGSNLVAFLLQTIFVALWSLLFVIPGIVKAYSYALTMFIMKDKPGTDGYEAIQESRRLMKGHKWELFVLDLSFFGWYFLSIFTLGILAVLYVYPYHLIARAGFYEELVAKDENTFTSTQVEY